MSYTLTPPPVFYNPTITNTSQCYDLYVLIYDLYVLYYNYELLNQNPGTMSNNLYMHIQNFKSIIMNEISLYKNEINLALSSSTICANLAKTGINYLKSEYPESEYSNQYAQYYMIQSASNTYVSELTQSQIELFKECETAEINLITTIMTTGNLAATDPDLYNLVLKIKKFYGEVMTCIYLYETNNNIYNANFDILYNNYIERNPTPPPKPSLSTIKSIH